MTHSIQQFVDDYMVVVENDHYGWLWHIAIAKDNNNDVYALAEVLRDEFEDYVLGTLLKVDSGHNDWRANVMREMLIGWGSQPYENIAREILARLQEGK